MRQSILYPARKASAARGDMEKGLARCGPVQLSSLSIKNARGGWERALRGYPAAALPALNSVARSIVITSREVITMYCPQCATPNADDVKFCRSCGRELETVALILSGKTAQPVQASAARTEPKTAEDWLEKRIEGVKGITGGAILLTISFLIGAALALFLPGTFDVPWILLWVVFFGWLAVWGGIEMANGLGNLLEAKSRLRLMGLAGKEAALAAIPPQSLSAGEPRGATPAVALRPAPPLSVTEGTTRHLDDHTEKEG